MPIAAPAKPSRALLRLGILGGWILFLLMVLAITWAGALLRGQRFNFASTLVWNLGWLLWAAATFLVAWLARRFPLERAHLARGIAVHVAFGIAIGVAILGLEFLLQHALEALVPGAPRANAFLGFIVYKFHVYFLIYWMIVGSTRAYMDWATADRQAGEILSPSQFDAWRAGFAHNKFGGSRREQELQRIYNRAKERERTSNSGFR
jgi:hypothetical protein